MFGFINNQNNKILQTTLGGAILKVENQMARSHSKHPLIWEFTEEDRLRFENSPMGKLIKNQPTKHSESI